MSSTSLAAPSSALPAAWASTERALAPAAPTPTRVALVGAGYIAEFHLAILRELPEVEVVAICDPKIERAERLARRFGVQGVLGEVSALANLRCDLAHVLVPPDRHVQVARALLELGIGVLLEKPAATDSRSARELGALAKARGLALGVNHNHVYQPAFQRLLGRVRAGEIGRVQHVQVTWSVALPQLEARDFGNWMFRSARNIVFEQAVHPLSQVHALLGPLVEGRAQILGTRELRPGQLFHDRWLLGARGEGGTAEVFLAFDQGFTRNCVQVIGSDGCLEADFTHDTLSGERKTRWLEAWNSFLASWRRHRAYGTDALRSLLGYAGATLGIAARRDAFFVGMRDSLAAFHRALRSGRTPPADAEVAAEVLEWCEALAAPASGAEAPRIALPQPALPRAGEIAVLGGTGFIGRRVVERLLARGLPVTLLARDPERLSQAAVEAARRGALRVVLGGLEDYRSIGGALYGARRVVHLATGGGASWEETERSMVQGTRALAEAALNVGVERFVYVSSIAALYTGDDAEELIEDSPRTDLSPEERSPYARGKIETERLLGALAKERGLPLVVLRPGVVVGEGTPMQHSGLGYWARDNQCIGWGRGDHPLPFVLVDDVADAIVLALLHPGDELHGSALNLAARVPIGAREMVAEMRKVSGRALEFHPRSLELSYLMEVGKYLVKRIGRHPSASLPGWRDLKARALVPAFSSRTAREALGWRPVEERGEFLRRALAHLAAPPAEPRA